MCCVISWVLFLGQRFLINLVFSTFVILDNVGYKEVMMVGGGVHSVPITIEKRGTAIAWEFNTKPKGVAFGIIYKPTSESLQEDEVRVHMYMYMHVHICVP